MTTRPTARAGQISHILIDLKRNIERGRIQPLLVMGIVPLCSAQYERLFGTTRLPGPIADELCHYGGVESDYCVCCRDGRWFKIPLTSPQGRMYTPAEMEVQFQSVWEEEEGQGGGAELGERLLPALTALKRDEWAEARQTHFAEGINKVSLEIIEKVVLESLLRSLLLFGCRQHLS